MLRAARYPLLILSAIVIVIRHMNWLSVAEIAKITRIPAPTARRYASLFKEYLPASKLGRVTKYSEDAIGIFERIAQLYAEGRVTPEIEEILGQEFPRTIDVQHGQGKGAPGALALAQSEVVAAFQQTMEKLGACLQVIADQKCLIEVQREDIQKLKTAFVLLARSQKKIRQLPGSGDGSGPELEARAQALEKRDQEIEEMAIGLSFETQDMRAKLIGIETELAKLKAEKRELEKAFQERLEANKPG